MGAVCGGAKGTRVGWGLEEREEQEYGHQGKRQNVEWEKAHEAQEVQEEEEEEDHIPQEEEDHIPQDWESHIPQEG